MSTRPSDSAIAKAFWIALGPDGGRISNDELADFVIQTAKEIDGAEDWEALLSEYRPSMSADVLHAWARDAVDAIRRLAAKPQEAYQDRVRQWMSKCFQPELYGNMTERGDRLLEEVLELLQSHGYGPARVATLVKYVYGRPAGNPNQEVGGVMVTLAGYCAIAGIDMGKEADMELARIMQPEIMEKIRAKQASKRDLHSPLPDGPSQSLQHQIDTLSAKPQDGQDRKDAERYRALVACGKFTPSMTRQGGWALRFGTGPGDSKHALDRAADQLVAAMAQEAGNG